MTDIFCNDCLWRRWDVRSNREPCIGRANELASNAMIQQGHDGNMSSAFEEEVEKAKMLLLNEELDCTDPNLDIDDYDDGGPSSNGTIAHHMNDADNFGREESSFVHIIALVAFVSVVMFCFTRKVWLKRRGLLSTKKLILIVGAVGAAIAATSTLRGIETTSNRATNIDENMVTGNNAHFTLCDRDVYLENMPRLPSDLEFGFPRSAWRRNQTYAILMDSAFLYGRTGNHVREFFHAFDMARDGSRALIVEERGLPIDIPLNELFAGLRRSHLEEALGLAFYGDVPERHRETLVSVRGGQLVQYKGAYPLQERIDHRNYVLRELYRLTAKEMELHPNSPFARGMCQSLNTLFGSDKQDTPGSKHIGTEKYTVIHSRSFEGNGYKLLEGDSEAYNIDPRAMIDFPPDLILAILSPLGMVNSSMVMISDGQNASVAERLSSHPTIGPHFRVVPRENSTMLGDMMLAILGDVFVGNPVSTYSHYIALVRYALGIGPSYMHARRKEDGEWETFCEDVKCFHELHKP